MSILVANRLAKASRYVDFLDAHLAPNIDPAVFVDADDSDWARIAELAGEHIPSVATRTAIVAGLSERRSASRRSA